MINELELKERLQAIEQNQFHPSAEDDVSELIPAMLHHIGSTDGNLRDKLIYSSFSSWILNDNAVDHEQLRKILSVITDEQHILYKIGEQNTDSVFTRAFSVLIIPLLLISNRAKPFITTSEIYEIKRQLLIYLENEKDLRGHVDGKGWAHSIAHAMDAVDDLVQCGELNKSDLEEILEAIQKVVCLQEMVYTHGEDERIVTPVIAIIKRGLLSDDEISKWIKKFSEITLTIKTWPEKLYIRSNVKNFLQSFYFRLHWELETNRFEVSINQTLKKINPFVDQEGG